MPSSRRQSRASRGSVSAVTSKPGTAAAARSANRLTASPPSAPTASGGMRMTTSPGRSSGWRLVTISTGPPPCKIAWARAAQASMTCSQVSRMSSRRWPRSRSASQSGGGRSCWSFSRCPPCCPPRRPSAAPTRPATPAASRAADRSARSTPSGNSCVSSLATLTASLVFPTPPGPVNVTSRSLASADWMAAASCDRPKNLEVSAGSLPPCVIKVVRPFPRIPTLVRPWA